MIKGILIVNNHGKPRIVKFYEHVVRCFALYTFVVTLVESLRAHVLSAFRVCRDCYVCLMCSRRVATQPDAEQQAVIRDIYTQVSKRPDTLCNFLEGTYVRVCLSLTCCCCCS